MSAASAPRARAHALRWGGDAVLAAAATLFLVLTTRHIPVPTDRHPVDPAGYALLAAAGVSMAWLRRRPLVVLATAAVVLTVFVVRHYPNGPVWATGLVALFAASRRSGRRRALVAAAAFVAELAVAAAVAGDGQLLVPLIYLGWAAAAVFAGDALRNRRLHLAQLEERARYLEHTREEETRRRVAEERLRIARDLHDSVAHAMATINVQAGAAAHVVDRRPEAAKEALAAIRHASRDVLDELAAMLALLRDDGAAERGPTPTIADIPRLVDDIRDRTGLEVRLRLDGPVASVPAPISTAAYRIVQESLTNVVRHAGAATAQVTVDVTGGGTCVEVIDDGRGTPGAAGTGTGIRGMRERAESTGGLLLAGPEEGGFAVRARWEGRP